MLIDKSGIVSIIGFNVDFGLMGKVFCCRSNVPLFVFVNYFRVVFLCPVTVGDGSLYNFFYASGLKAGDI